ncbi:hypothetical protein UPTC5117_00619 [Campylobacter lari]|uniref:hypothetical protein n=1 Tax=Campylobacter lari TaxID=201 RepID=UPI002152B07A|nr:hypothetical protein [Campylobacter lari]MCR6529686.1 hypothetical protein [Campylobacter lari]
MREQLNRLFINDIEKLSSILNINIEDKNRTTALELINQELNKQNDEEQYKILKDVFSQGKFELIIYKLESSFIPKQIKINEFIFPKNKNTLFIDAIEYYFNHKECHYVCCIKKHLNNSNLSPTQTLKQIRKKGIDGTICITHNDIKEIFSMFIGNKELKKKFDLNQYKSVILYSSHSTSSQHLSTNCKLSSNNEKISKNNKIDRKGIVDDLTIHNMIKKEDLNKIKLIDYFVVDFPKNFIDALKDVGINLCFKKDTILVRYNFIFKINGSVFIRNYDTELKDIIEISKSIIDLKNEISRK